MNILRYPLDDLQRSPSPSSLFSSPSTSADSGAIQIPFVHHQLLKPRDALPLSGCNLRMSSSHQPGFLSSSHNLSASVSTVSELFKTTSISEEFKLDQSTYTPCIPCSPALMSSLPKNPPLESLHITPGLLYLSHLSDDRMLSREIVPPFSLPSWSSHDRYGVNADHYSLKFPCDHELNPRFAELYQLGDELGSGGYGFVMTARHRLQGHEVAVKFIVKAKMPEYAWSEDELLGRLPTEAVVLQMVNHENIVTFLDLFEDNLYFYLVQELHGAPWQHLEGTSRRIEGASTAATPSLSPSASERSLDPSEPATPPSLLFTPSTDMHTFSDAANFSSLFDYKPEYSRRPSHDLFECIEQSEEKRLPEAQARYVFAQVVDVVQYLDNLGVAHRDIKDENIVIDRDFKVKLIDFGSAAVEDPMQPRPYYNQFYGTAAYASSEILLKRKYQAAPAEIWTLGVLLSYLLTGTSPFPSVRDAVNGDVMISGMPGINLSEDVVDLMRRCLDPNPETRITIQQVREHAWLVSPGHSE